MLLSSKWLLFGAVFGVFAVAEMVQQQQNVATQSGLALILHTVAQEMVAAAIAVAMGFFFLQRATPSKQQVKLEKKQLAAQKLESSEDSDVSTAEGDSDAPNDDSDSEGMPSSKGTPRDTPSSSPAIPPRVPEVPPPPTFNYSRASRPKPRICRDDVMKSKNEQLSWRQDAANHQGKSASSEILGPKPTTGKACMPSTLSAGGCALLQLLREEQKTKLSKEGSGGAAAPPGLQ